MLKANKKGINRSRRDLDKEIRALERQEAKVQLEIKQLAHKGQNSAAKLMAKELIRIRKQKEQLLKTKVTLGTVASRTEVNFRVCKLTHRPHLPILPYKKR